MMMIIPKIRERKKLCCLIYNGAKFSTSVSKRDTRRTTAGIIVTGDEILKGQVADTNSNYIAKNLYQLGIKLMKISVVNDSIDNISSEVREFSSKYNFVFTTGGIGPTHDDITYEAVAKAFNDELFHHPTLVQICFDFFKTNDMNHPALKLALIPKTSKLIFGFNEQTKQPSLYPNVNVKNVYIFPGVPQLCERMFQFISPIIFKDIRSKFHLRELYLTTTENNIVNFLNQTVTKYPEVSFGSYPNFFHSYYMVKITVESNNENEASEAQNYLKNLIPQQYIIEYDSHPFINKEEKLNKIIGESNNSLLNSTLENLRIIFKEYKGNEVCFYFDGSKNSTLLLHLLSVINSSSDSPNEKLQVIYIKYKDSKDIDKFISSSEKNYNLNLSKFNFDLNKSLKTLIALNPEIKLLVIASRENDSSSENLLPTFENVNFIKIINPMTKWSYNDVWEVICKLYLPYCQLYDKGFTSIYDSEPDSKLITDGPRKDVIYYKKAYELESEK